MCAFVELQLENGFAHFAFIRFINYRERTTWTVTVFQLQLTKPPTCITDINTGDDVSDNEEQDATSHRSEAETDASSTEARLENVNGLVDDEADEENGKVFINGSLTISDSKWSLSAFSSNIIGVSITMRADIFRMMWVFLHDI